jgi:MFS family permease
MCALGVGVPVLSRIGALLGAVFLFVIGQGLVGTLTGAEGRSANFSPFALGIIGAGYYLGFVVGCLSSHFLARGLGHRQLFICTVLLAGLAAASYLLVVSPPAWFLCRTTVGFACANFYILVESWLNETAVNANRGRVLGTYAFVKQAGSFFSQSILIAAGGKSLQLFLLAATGYLFSAFPVAIIPPAHSDMGDRGRILPREVWSKSPSGAFVCTATGIVNGAIWSLAPGYGTEHGFAHGLAGAFMGSFVLGGILMPFPLGWISDRMDRRLVMLLAAACAAVAEAVLASLTLERGTILGLMLAMGMSALPLYVLGVAWTNDRMPSDFVMGTAATLLFFNGLASMLGPLIAGSLAQRLGSQTIFTYAAFVHGAIAVWILWHIVKRPLRRPVL